MSAPPTALRSGYGIKGQQHLPGDEAWLIGEQRVSGKKYYLANLPAATDLRTLAATIKARWICEQAHQQLKEELGLDHFEGRSWQGLHRHALMTMIAYAFLQHRRLAYAGGKKESTGLRLSQPCPPYVTPSSISSFGRRLNGARIAENKSLKNSGANTFCQSSASSANNVVEVVVWRRKSGPIAGDERYQPTLGELFILFG
ncbi:hypothetical protein ACVWYH_007882 [Bradyrhizobium sp. GM24.11]